MVDQLAPRIAHMKATLLAAPYEICLARALHFTDVYRETEGVDPALRNAMALRRTLARQRIRIEPDELLVGNKTEKTLAGPLSVERGDFLRALQLELDVLERKRRPFVMSERDKRLFWTEILPYWNGRTVRDRKAKEWRARGLFGAAPGLRGAITRTRDTVRFVRYVGAANLRKIMGANYDARPTPRRLKNLYSLRNELATDHPTAAVYCFDVQGHLCLGVDKVVSLGMEAIVWQLRERLERLLREEPKNERGAAFLKAAAMSLEAAMAYAERFAVLALRLAEEAKSDEDRARLERIAKHCRWVPRKPPRTFHEALQTAWFTQVVAEIQFGMMDVFAQGRVDQFLYPLYRKDLDAGRLTHAEALALLQEYYLKLSANITPTPELGMEANSVLGNSQHCLTIGGVLPDGHDATNELSFAMLDAYEQLGGCVNQIAVRLHEGTPDAFLRRVVSVMRVANGLSLHNDVAVLRGLAADGYASEDARNYCIVGCVETCGQSDTQGCVAAQEFTLPAVLLAAFTSGRSPPPAPGQRSGYDSGDAATCPTFDAFLELFKRQLAWQLEVMVDAVAGKDIATRELLPAPYVSALTDGCIAQARDVSDGGAKYDFTTIVMKGLGTTVDALLSLRHFVYERRELSLSALRRIVLANFEGQEELRRRILREPPKYGVGDERADALTEWLVGVVHELVSGRRNVRGGKFRVAYFSYGNHVIDGLFLGPTPDGRRRGEPISNGVSPSNLVEAPAGPLGSMRTAARIAPENASSGVALNIRVHPSFIAGRKLETAVALLRTYFRMGGMHVAFNVVSTETLRDAQRHPERHRDLIVKVSGYSASFTDLGRSIQDDLIARLEFGG